VETDWVYTRWLELSRRGNFECHNNHIEYIIDSYRGRAYHSINHIKYMLDIFDTIQHIVPHPVEAELIIWLHDLIQGVPDSEKECAKAARALLEEAKFSGDVDLVCDGIQATDHISTRFEDDWKDWPIDKMVTVMVVCDLDLAILGGTVDDYATYRNGIRQEYLHIPEKDFLEGRLQIMQHFNSPKPIFMTEHLRVKFESRARINMAREISDIKRKLAEISTSPPSA